MNSSGNIDRDPQVWRTDWTALNKHVSLSTQLAADDIIVVRWRSYDSYHIIYHLFIIFIFFSFFFIFYLFFIYFFIFIYLYLSIWLYKVYNLYDQIHIEIYTISPFSYCSHIVKLSVLVLVYI